MRMKITDGWLDKAKKVPSPNFNIRPENASVNLLVIHNISLPPEEFGTPYIELFFQNKLPHDAHPYFEHLKGIEVSSHFLIKRDGQTIQFVSCEQRAWHAGESEFCGEHNCNDFSIGIELEGSDTTPYTSEQYKALDEITLSIQSAYPAILKNRITGHQDISPNRKTDPGKFFDWQRYLGNLPA
jgi:AmpD protein